MNVNGVGYLVKVSAATAGELANGEEARLFIHTQVSESDISLYGFLEKEELAFFKQLISVSGVGPKTALGILASPAEVVKQAIFSEDAVSLAKFPGIGKKTAERIIVELKAKVSLNGDAKTLTNKVINDEALEALLSLGYAKYEAVKMLEQVPEDVKDVGERIRMALTS